MTTMINLKINGNPVSVPEGTNILDAAKRLQIKIPALCYHPDLPAWAADSASATLLTLGDRVEMAPEKYLQLYEIMDEMTGWE